ncbi:MAG: molybdopterin biosynthesis protein, partial [Comamonadaceae bacterium]
FITIGQHTEILDAGAPVQVQLLGHGLDAADLIFIGSHCVGLDWLSGQLIRQGLRIKTLSVGSTGGLMAAKRGECDVAGIHLMDPATGIYNRPLLTPALSLVPGYGRMQGIVYRPGDSRFEGRNAAAAMAAATADAGCTLVNRNAGSGTRILIDRLLGGLKPPGYGVQTKSHNAVAVAVAQQRADWGLAIDTVARQYGLGFIPVQEESYDFVVPTARLDRAPVQAFVALLQAPPTREALRALGFRVDNAAGASA